MNTKKNMKKFDIAIIGGGPIGIAFACGFANTKTNIVIIEKKSEKKLEKPDIDGREIALTHRSVNILKDLGVWYHIPTKFISYIKKAKVLNGNSYYSLDFDHQHIQKDCLGYLLPNHLVKKYLYKKVKKITNVRILDNVSCKTIESHNKNVSSITLSNGQKIKSKLIVASDGRFSKVRKMMGIDAFTHNFDKNMIVCRMEHEKPHNNTAYEFFKYTQTQALLPYIKKQSSIVTTASKHISDELMKINGKKFNKEMQSNFDNFFGKMKLIGKRYSYPMITTYSKKFITTRFALIGDSAVGMHPVTAHGFNLGLQGIEILLKEIKSALKINIDFSSSFILKKYQSELRRVALPLYLSTNSIVSLYTNTSIPALVTRQLALRAANIIKPVKETFLHVLK